MEMDARRVLLDYPLIMPPRWSFDSVRITVPPTERRCGSDWFWNARAPLLDFDLWLVESGEGRMDLDGESWELHAGDVVLLTPGTRPRATHRPDRPLHVHFAHFVPLRGGRELTRLAEAPGPGRWRVRDLPALAGALRLAGKRAREAEGGECAEAWLTTVLRDVVMQALRPEPAPADEALARLIAEVSAEPERGWTVATMARACGRSPQHFTRLFRAATGRAPMEFVIRERVRLAEQALLESSEPVKRIAERLGYADVYYFHRQFRRVTGRTPGQLRGGG
jgi:AraC-type DNA-binding domain-containing proteins